MKVKTHEKQKAVALRRDGKSYSEILKEIPVAKSTLSLWLREVGLSTPQKQQLTEKKVAGALRGAQSRHMQRVELTDRIYAEAMDEIKSISRRELWFMGVMLYWAEGGKEKKYRPGSGIDFSNSDAYMVRLFLKWLIEIGKVEKSRINLSIYIHENNKARVSEVMSYWSKHSGFPREGFKQVYFKKHKVLTNRKNIGEEYFGTLRIKVSSSSNLNRQIWGWVLGINQLYWDK